MGGVVGVDFGVPVDCCSVGSTVSFPGVTSVKACSLPGIQTTKCHVI